MPALPSTGPISLNDIRTQLGVSTKTNFSIDSAENGDVSNGYPAINDCSPSKPSDADGASFSEWYNYDHNAACVSNAIQAVYCNYAVTMCDQQYSSASVPQTTSTSTSYIGCALMDILNADAGSTQYNFRLYLSTAGVTENGQYVEASLASASRHVPTNSTSATTSYLIAGTGVSIFSTSRGYRFGVNLVLLMQNYPSITSFNFDLYGARLVSGATSNTMVRRSVKHQTLVNVPPANNIDFGTTITETNIIDDYSKICAAVGTYVKVGTFTYNKATDTISYTNTLSNLSCTPA